MTFLAGSNQIGDAKNETNNKVPTNIKSMVLYPATDWKCPT